MTHRSPSSLPPGLRPSHHSKEELALSSVGATGFGLCILSRIWERNHLQTIMTSRVTMAGKHCGPPACGVSRPLAPTCWANVTPAFQVVCSTMTRLQSTRAQLGSWKLWSRVTSGQYPTSCRSANVKTGSNTWKRR